MFNRLCIFLLVASPTAVLAQEQLIPIVNAVSENVAGTTITIAGTFGFANSPSSMNVPSAVCVSMQLCQSLLRFAVQSGSDSDAGGTT